MSDENYFCIFFSVSSIFISEMFVYQVFHAPLQRRYDRSYICVWKLAVSSLLQVLATGIPLARKHYSEFESMWSELATALNILLFPERYLNRETFTLLHTYIEPRNAKLEQLLSCTFSESLVVHYLSNKKPSNVRFYEFLFLSIIE